ncbi:sigma 54-interacting transcriptional regulator [Mucilaginibacter angelicae]|uniref:Sigma 54-interacting transcriptional regulator n=1 Tax=Mucilaginibacter angelicae TaxID=869718 RepID=A0ABV6L350_9SPHI
MKHISTISDGDLIFQNSIILELSKSETIDDLLITAGTIASYLKFQGAFISLFDKDYDSYNFLGHEPNDDAFFGKSEIINNYGSFLNEELYVKGIIRSTGPFKFDLAQLSKEENLPDHFRYCVQRGYNILLSFVIKNQSHIVGIIWFAGHDTNLPTIAVNSVVPDLLPFFGTVLNNIITNIKIEEEQKNRQLLLSLGRDLADIRTKTQFQDIIDSRFKPRFNFTHSYVGTISDDLTYFTSFMMDRNSRSRHHSDFNFENGTIHKIDRLLYDCLLIAEDPTILDLDELIKIPDAPDYIKINYDVGTKEMVLFQLRESRGIRAFLCFYFNSKRSVNKPNLRILKELGELLSTAIVNILTYEELQKQELTNKLLLDFSNKVASARDSKGLVKIVKNQFRNTFACKYCKIRVINSETFTHFPLFEDSQADNRPRYHQHGHFPVNDGFFNQLVESEDFLEFEVEKLLKAGTGPGYIQQEASRGIKWIWGVTLKDGTDTPAVLLIFFRENNPIKAEAKDLLLRMTYLLSFAVSNYIARFRIEEREKEKDVLLDLGQEMITIRDKNDLLTLINVKLKRLIDIDHTSLILLNENGKKFNSFLIEPNSAIQFEDNLDNAISNWQNADEIIVKVALKSYYPVVIDLDKIINNPAIPDYIRLNYEAGIRELCVLPLRNNKKNIGLLMLFSNHKGTFLRNELKILKGVTHQLSIAVSDIISREQIFKREQERDYLLAAGNFMAKIKDKKDLLEVLNNYLKKLVHFTTNIILLLSEDRSTMNVFLADPDFKSKSYLLKKDIPGYRFNVDDDILKDAFKTEHANVINLSQYFSRQNETPPDWLKFYYDSDMKWLVTMPLLNDVKPFGIAIFLSNRAVDFEKNALGIIEGVSNQMAIAVSNILANEAIRKRELEKEVLLSLSHDVSRIRDKNDLISMINNQFKKLFYFNYSTIGVTNEDSLTFSFFLTDPNSLSRVHKDYAAINASKFPLTDGFLDNYIWHDEPYIFDLVAAAQGGYLPPYLVPAYDCGLKEVLAIRILSDNAFFGAICFFSNIKGSFHKGQTEIVKGITDQVSTAVANIMANEKAIAREREKELLLAISHEIGVVRDRESLWGFINNRLHKFIGFTRSAVLRICEDRTQIEVYFKDVNGPASIHPAYMEYILSPQSIDDGVFNLALESDEPYFINYKDLLDTASPPPIAAIHHELGYKEAVLIPLQGEKEHWGLLFIAADREGTFTERNINILKGVASQVGVVISNIVANEEIHIREQEKATLLSISYELGNIRDKEKLLTFINTSLRRLINFSNCSIASVDKEGKTFSWYLTDPQPILTDHPEYEQVANKTYPVLDGIYNQILNSEEPTIFDVAQLNAQLPDTHSYAKLLYKIGLKEAVTMPLKDETGNVGVLTFYAEQKNSFSANALKIIKGVSSQISIAASNIRAHEDIAQREQEKSWLLSFSKDIALVKNKKELAVFVDQYFKNVFKVNDFIILIKNDDNTVSYFMYNVPEHVMKDHLFQAAVAAPAQSLPDFGATAMVLNSEEPVVLNVNEMIINRMVRPDGIPILKLLGFEEVLGIRLVAANEPIGILWTRPNQVNTHLLKGLSAQISSAIANIKANQKIVQHLSEINKYKQQLEQENLYLQDEIGTSYNHSEIIGSGGGMQKIFQMVSQVANSNSTVLLLGETGTGKELIARAIHNSSARKDKLMIKVNCAALPANLVESELFGHERGSFTGAIERKLGKFELANKSTLFLDEVGEMPPELQVKLLRVLQEREIERVGGKSTIKIDVRIIAATNRDLKKEVDEGRFRDDLYYRLNVFPLMLPPLRSRKEDIPLLTSFFINRYSKTSGKNTTNISQKAMKELMEYSWPGNVRELEHIIERSVLLANSDTIKKVPLPVFEQEIPHTENENYSLLTIEENEREHILKALKMTKGKVSGYNGAAEILGVPYSTLTSKMRKLGIRKAHYFPEK